jgi:RNA recognition motif-containing protein
LGFAFNLLIFYMNIFVASLDYAVQDEDLRSTFEAFGEVSSVKIIMDRETGRSRGFGFVEMPNEDEGSAAIEAVDGTNLRGRDLAVKEARPQEERSNDGGGFRGGNRW